jgi:Zn-dependent protease/CBS domain-containing protein
MGPVRTGVPRESGISGTVGILKVFGVPIRFHFTFILLLTFLIVMGLGGQQSALTSVLYIAALFGSVLLHEIGHALVAKRYGIRTIEIVMFPIGGIARLERSPKPFQEFWIAIAGPVVNLVIAGAAFSFLEWRHAIAAVAESQRPSDLGLIERIAFGNLLLAAFNMIPAFPMDGGRVLRSVLARFKSEDEATRIAAAAGRLLAIAMAFYGLLSTQYMLVFIAFFVYLGAAQESAVAKGRLLTHGVPVQAAMVTDYHTLAHGDTIRDAINLLLSTSQQDFPVMHGEQVVGLLGRNMLMKAMASEGPESYVAAAMERNYVAFPPNMNLAEALPLMAQGGPCALVMDNEQLLGLLTTDNLSEFLVLRSIGLDPARVRQSA